jgi:hypothetical protein
VKKNFSGIGVKIKTWNREESRPALCITGIDYCVDLVRIKVFHNILNPSSLKRVSRSLR